MNTLTVFSLSRLPIAFLLLLSLWCGESQALSGELQVFVLHSYHQEYPWTKSQNEGFVAELSSRFADRNLSFTTEYLDTKRVPFSSAYRQFFAGYLRQKYQGYRPDILFSTDDNALQFFLEFRQELFPDVPVVFCGVNSLAVEPELDPKSFTGVYEVKEIDRNIDLVRQLLPAEKTILVVGDNSETDAAIRADIITFINNTAVAGDLNFTFISENSLRLLVERLQRVERGVVLLTTIGGLHNEKNQPVALGRSLQAIAGAGNFVIISMEDAYMHAGVLGGVVTSGEAQGRAAARLATTIVQTGGSGAVKPPSPGPNMPTFDYNELKKLHISQKLLPAQSVILQAPRAIYQEFRKIIWGIAAFICLLLALLSFLFMINLRRKKAEKALAESERFLNSVIENIPDMVFVKRADDLRFVRLNRTGERFLNMSNREIIGRNVFEIFPEEIASSFAAQDKETLEGRKLLDIAEERVETPAGTRYLHTKKIPLFGEEGEPAYVLGISRDITRERCDREKRKELEERLLQAEKMESIGTLAGGIAHDFNNILSSVIGYAELARLEAENPEKVRNYLEGSLKGAERAKALIRQILTFSRKNDHLKLPVDPAGVVAEALTMLRSTLPSSIAIEEDLAASAVILADPTQIHQIIFNLCTNASHAMLERGGTLAVSLKLTEFEAGQTNELLDITSGRYLRIEVGDTGMGMDPETRQRMFDPYYTTKGPETGTGLGLAVVHGIVRSHRGHIHVYSEKDVGTTVHVYLPLLEHQAVEQEVVSAMAASAGNGEHILLVDDEEDIIAVHSHFLSRHGYHVTSFTDGREALTALKTQPEQFAALITDMTMPHMTGAELAREALAILPLLPVILCTGHSEIVNREKALNMGIRAYCEKPMRGDELLVQLRAVLGSSPVA